MTLTKIFFKNIPDEERAYFESMVQHTHLEKNDFFQHSGSICNKIAIVQSGLLKSFILTADGKEKIVEFYSEGMFVSSFTSFVTGKITEWNIQALEHCSLSVLSKESLQKLYLHHPFWIELGLKIFEEQTLKKCNREKSLLINSASERYELFFQQYRHIESRLALNQIALYLGITPETLSRIRKTS